MPEKKTLERARRDRREGKAATTQAGEFVREEMEHVKRGKHGVKSRKQAIAIGLSKARRSGVKLPRRGAKGSARKGTSSRTSSRKASSRKAAPRKGTARRTGAARRTSRKAPARRTSRSRR